MKLPLDFGLKLIFRLVIPGVLLAAAMVPLVHWAMQSVGVHLKFEYIFPIEIIGWGWAVVICDMHIYMLFEGRRYWPGWLREWMVKREEKRLNRAQESMAKYRRAPPAGTPNAISESERRARYLEASVEYGWFPLNEDGNVSVPRPTRLGNLIESFESYPSAVYGLDSVFYWYRLWIVLDKESREELDNAQALADSTVYLTFVLYLSAIMMLVYALFSKLGVNFAHVPNPLMLCVLAICCLLIGFVIYRLSFHTQAQYGELFKAVFDQYRTKLNFDDVLTTVGEIAHLPYLALKPQREKNMIVWRYLRWRRIRDDGTGENKPVGEWR